MIANSSRRRTRAPDTPATTEPATGPNLIELAHRRHYPRTEA
ncbi:hypothetical protein VSR69_40720 [Paraburkholderia phytofirmans]